ncbi:hypothetical protein FSARC_7162 [Fusarium sarcochroum]|uniref:BZIP domain-containing protein n=1 Tax=Fusarium sarcochroum TaxID=1208366 RepID=A0A8H4X8J8_9HYPO|nr:hypothetical protein FSARC_7162 [Fusarium sarcochroum]
MTGGKKEGSANPSAVRIRDNQRRSRARHKEYVEGLQKKLQDYERRGVEATLEMQQAARSVAVENSRLKILLGYHGITNDDVEKFLQSFPDQPASDAAKATISQATSGQQPALAPKIPLQPLSRAPSADPPRSTLTSSQIAMENSTSTRDVVDAVVGIKRDSRKAGLSNDRKLPPIEQRQPLLQPRPQPPMLPALPALVLGQGRPEPNPLDKLSVLATASPSCSESIDWRAKLASFLTDNSQPTELNVSVNPKNASHNRRRMDVRVDNVRPKMERESKEKCERVCRQDHRSAGIDYQY